MSDTASSSAVQIEVGGRFYKLENRYKEGDRLTAAEAAVLNTQRRNSIRNIFYQKTKDWVEPASSVLAGIFSEVADSFEFTATSVPNSIDPVERKAIAIATELVEAFLKKSNLPKDSLLPGRFDEMVRTLLAEKPSIREEAENRIAATRALAGELTFG